MEFLSRTKTYFYCFHLLLSSQLSKFTLLVRISVLSISLDGKTAKSDQAHISVSELFPNIYRLSIRFIYTKPCNYCVAVRDIRYIRRIHTELQGCEFFS